MPKTKTVTSAWGNIGAVEVLPPRKNPDIWRIRFRHELSDECFRFIRALKGRHDRIVQIHVDRNYIILMVDATGIKSRERKRKLTDIGENFRAGIRKEAHERNLRNKRSNRGRQRFVRRHPTLIGGFVVTS